MTPNVTVKGMVVGFVKLPLTLMTAAAAGDGGARQLSLTDRELDRAKTQWIEFDVIVPFEGEPTRVRAAIYDDDRDSIRGATARVAQRK